MDKKVTIKKHMLNVLIGGNALEEIEILEGSHYLHHTQSKKIAELTNNFLSKK